MDECGNCKFFNPLLNLCYGNPPNVVTGGIRPTVYTLDQACRYHEPRTEAQIEADAND